MHGSLVHGGSPVSDPDKTRQSFVLHFDAERNQARSAQTVRIGDNPPRVVETRSKLERNGTLYFDNPCAGKTLAEITGIGADEAKSASGKSSGGLLRRLFDRR